MSGGGDVVAKDAAPVMMTNTYVEVGGVNLECLCESVSLEPENKPIEITTFCGVKDYPGPVKWHFKAKFVQSFDLGGTDEALYTALMAYQTASTPVTFKVRPYSNRPVSATNPEFSGDAIPQPYTVFGGDAGNASEVDIDWIMDAPPTKDIGTLTQHLPDTTSEEPITPYSSPAPASGEPVEAVTGSPEPVNA